MWPDKSHYKGEFKNNEFDGSGEYQWSDGRKYIGGWKNNKMNGEGELHYEKSIFKGTYLDD